MLDTKEEQRYERLRKLAQELHIPIPEAFLTLEVFDKDGKLIQRHHQRSHSWVRNAYNVLFSQLAGKNVDDVTFGAGLISLKKTDGAIQSDEKCGGTSADVDGLTGYRAAGGDDLYGILVGSGTNAESFEEYFLQTQLTEGTGAGQISHVASEEHSISYAALVLKNTLIRYFNNNSEPAGDRNINEVALVFYELMHKYEEVLMARDKLASTVTVPVTGQLKVTYTVQLTYPS